MPAEDLVTITLCGSEHCDLCMDITQNFMEVCPACGWEGASTDISHEIDGPLGEGEWKPGFRIRCEGRNCQALFELVTPSPHGGPYFSDGHQFKRVDVSDVG